MAYEIYQSYDSASNLYAFVYRPSDGYIYDVGDTAFEAIGAWNDARADECDIAMTAVGDIHFADFPTVAAGRYVVQVRLKAGASPDTDDTPLSQGMIDWDGTAEVFFADITSDISDVEDKVDIVDTNVDTILEYEETIHTEEPVEEPPETRARIYL